ncbi:hypothetical protein [Salibacterium aidingense]|uniref:hypothetical protein n=1 Tax=Salibacterium aidingense TaxID=384933 RepID=UPI0003FF82DD|nr:hypothetical protein [Salibacterium aidingense]
MGNDYYIHIKQERNDHFLVIGENGITISDSDYEILGKNTPRRLLENLELDWEVTVR